MGCNYLFAILFSTIFFFQFGFSRSLSNLNQTKSNFADTTLNDLSFDSDEGSELGNLLPEKISFMEKFLWAENGFFRKVGIASPLTPESRSRELLLRRTMLTIHQTAGMITWGLMTASTITGQLWLDGKISSPDLHRLLVYSSVGGYLLTGLISVVIPPPIIRRDEFSTITIHKTLAWAHFLGMVTTPLLGRYINQSSDYYKTARVHQISAYVTTAIYTSAMLVILLFE